MKRITCLIPGLTTATLLLTFVGCSNLNNTGSTTSSLAARKPGQANALLIGQDGSGAYVNTGGSSGSCPGTYVGYAYITNNATGTVWFTPPAGTTNGVVTDVSGLPEPYGSVIKVWRKDIGSWCDTNDVSFSASSAKQYKFVIYVKSGAPTNGEPLSVDVQWQP